MPLPSQHVLAFTRSHALAHALQTRLPGNGYDLSVVRSPEELEAKCVPPPPALVLVDRSDVALGRIREALTKQAVPLVLLQPPGSPCKDEDCADDLVAGVDQVICTPSFREVIARIRSILRRQTFSAARSAQYRVGALVMDLDRHEVTLDGRSVALTPKEFLILQHLMQSPQRVFSRQELLNLVWGEDYALEEHTLDVHIYGLRQKLEPDPPRPRFLATVRGVGYKLLGG